MNEEPERTSGRAGQKADTAKQERLAQALRANLKRRKAQIRGRAIGTQPGPEPATDDN